jgi:hypothetical protein
VEQKTVIVRQVNGETVEEQVGLPPMPAHKNEGKTPAGWTLMYVVGLGALLIAIGMPMDSAPLMITGGVVIVVGVVASAIMRAMGLGQPLRPREDDRDA